MWVFNFITQSFNVYLVESHVYHTYSNMKEIQQNFMKKYHEI